MRKFVILLAFLTGASLRADTIGTDASGPWRTEVRTNEILRGTSREIVETVITNRITQEEYQSFQKLASEERHWREQVALIREGMRRDEIEKLLPPYTEPENVVGKSSGYSLSYWVDEHWRVAMWYQWAQPGMVTNGASRLWHTVGLGRLEIPSYIKRRAYQSAPANGASPRR